MTGWIGTLVSGTFLYAIAALNVVILWGILKVFRKMKHGAYDEAELEDHLNNRGLMNRYLGRLTRTVTKPQQMYPIGVLFGLGFDTATEIALLVLAGGAAGRGAALVRDPLPADPVRRRDVAARHDRRLVHELRLRLGVLEAGAQDLLQPHGHGPLGRGRAGDRHDRARRPASRRGSSLDGPFWTWFENIDLNVVGFVIVGLFIATWAIAMAIWKYGRIEERWTAHLSQNEASTTVATP